LIHQDFLKQLISPVCESEEHRKDYFPAERIDKKNTRKNQKLKFHQFFFPGVSTYHSKSAHLKRSQKKRFFFCQSTTQKNLSDSLPLGNTKAKG